MASEIGRDRARRSMAVRSRAIVLTRRWCLISRSRRSHPARAVPGRLSQGVRRMTAMSLRWDGPASWLVPFALLADGRHPDGWLERRVTAMYFARIELALR